MELDITNNNVTILLDIIFLIDHNNISNNIETKLWDLSRGIALVIHTTQ